MHLSCLHRDADGLCQRSTQQRDLRRRSLDILYAIFVQGEQPGEFAKASEDVLKTRRIIKARRAGGGLASTQPAAATSNGAAPAGAPEAAAKSSNPFAGVSLLAPTQEAPAAPVRAVLSAASCRWCTVQTKVHDLNRACRLHAAVYCAAA